LLGSHSREQEASHSDLQCYQQSIIAKIKEWGGELKKTPKECYRKTVTHWVLACHLSPGVQCSLQVPRALGKLEKQKQKAVTWKKEL
jgi:hypothetical protein